MKRGVGLTPSKPQTTLCTKFTKLQAGKHIALTRATQRGVQKRLGSRWVNWVGEGEGVGGSESMILAHSGCPNT